MIKIARYAMRFQFRPAEEKCFSKTTEKLTTLVKNRSNSTMTPETVSDTKKTAVDDDVWDATNVVCSVMITKYNRKNARKTHTRLKATNKRRKT